MVYHEVTRKEDELKERVIHTRVPESLETELRKRAQDLGISVSNLVRNVLGHTFGLVNDVTADVNAIVNDALRPRGRTPAAPAEPLGWQTAVLAKNAVCSRCNTILPKGTDGAIAVVDAGPRPIICLPCLDQLRSKP
jgi:hypothetical protein